MTQKEFQALYEEYKDKIKDESIKYKLDEFYSMSQNNDVLLVTIVGSVKAGKSTFFNCIVNESQDVTETDTKECTIRPCFVYPGSKFSFKTYKRLSTGENNSININDLLNHFVDGKDNYVSNELKIYTKYDKGKLADYVKECQDKNSNILFASFSIDNQKSLFVNQLKGKKVVFVDMPGNDGANADKEADLFYQTILKRTDVVLLVCSSSNELTISLGKYLQYIQDNNPKVPFILVLNYRDDKATQPKDEEQNEHLNYFTEQLEKHKCVIVEKTVQNAHYAHTVRFNEPCDEHKKTIVQQYANKFDAFENELYSNFFNQNRISKIIEDNKNVRFKSQIEPFKKEIGQKIIDITTEENNFTQIVSEINFTKNELINALAQKRDEKESKNTAISEIKLTKKKTRWFWKRGYRKFIEQKIKDRIIPEVIQPFIDSIYSDYKKKLNEKIKKKFNDTEIVIEGNAPIFMDEENKKEDKNKFLSKEFYKSQIALELTYNADDLESTLKDIKNSLFTYEAIGSLIFDACDSLKQNVIKQLRNERHIEDHQELLTQLKAIKSKLID